MIAYIEKSTTGDLLKLWSKATGKPSVYVEAKNLEEYDSIWPNWGREMGVMMQLWEEVGEKSWSGESVLTKEDLGIQNEKFVGIEETFKSMDWSAIL